MNLITTNLNKPNWLDSSVWKWVTLYDIYISLNDFQNTFDVYIYNR